MGEAQLVAPDAGVAKMVAKRVKIKAVRDIRVDGKEYPPDAVVEVDEDTAKELCDRKFAGCLSFAGERHGDDIPRNVVTRAVRV